MATKGIQWETELQPALAKAKADQKPVLIDFFNPGWIGCQQMDAVTYPQKAVQEFMAGNIIAVRVAYDSPLAKDFKVTWTPTLVTIDWNGQEHHRTVGFLAAEELIASLLLASGKVYCDVEQFDRASAPLEKLLSAHSRTDAAPEAMYVRGVCGYKSTHNPVPLKAAWEQLQKNYPNSEWTKRAQPYSLL